MSTPAVLVATVQVRPGVETEFSAWKARHDQIVGKFPGFTGSDMIPPSQPGGSDWTILLNFASKEDLTNWSHSRERGDAVATARCE